jgi:NADP-dependent 3-hydroxy acid dehydrogenase YdfG
VSEAPHRIALVTGASRGIGLAAAELLEGEGFLVVRVARSLAPARSATRVNFAADLTRADRVESLAREVESSVGVPDLLVNNAGSFLLAPLEATSASDFSAQLETNLTAPFLVARAFLPAMRRRGRGRLVMIGSVADHRAFPDNSAYAAAKTGLRGLSGVLREELRGSGVSLTLLSPGPTDTAAWDTVDPDQRPGLLPRARMLRPRDVAEAILWVATRPDRVDIEELRLGPQ